jgi:hypothetical protein
MQINLENLEYQQKAIDTVVKVFDGNDKRLQPQGYV